jgi:hypothetical protein
MPRAASHPVTGDDDFSVEFLIHPEQGVRVHTIGLHTLDLPELVLEPDQETQSRLLDPETGQWSGLLVGRALVRLGQQLMAFEEPRFIPPQRFENEGRSAHFEVLTAGPPDEPTSVLLPAQVLTICPVRITDWLP